MKLLGETKLYVWHLRVQLWHWSGRKRRVPYRVVASGEKAAIQAVRERVPTTRGRVVTRCVQGREI